jgi:hypothetical protein
MYRGSTGYRYKADATSHDLSVAVSDFSTSFQEVRALLFLMLCDQVAGIKAVYRN